MQDPAAFSPGELEATLLPHPRLYKVCSCVCVATARALPQAALLQHGMEGAFTAGNSKAWGCLAPTRLCRRAFSASPPISPCCTRYLRIRPDTSCRAAKATKSGSGTGTCVCPGRALRACCRWGKEGSTLERRERRKDLALSCPALRGAASCHRFEARLCRRCATMQGRTPTTHSGSTVQEYAGVRAAGGMPAYRARREARQQPVHYVARRGGALEAGGTSTMFGGPFPP